MIHEKASEPLSKTPVFAGLSFRRFLGAQDYPAMTAIINAANVEDGVEEVERVEEVANEYSPLARMWFGPRFDDRQPAGFAATWND